MGISDLDIPVSNHQPIPRRGIDSLVEHDLDTFDSQDKNPGSGLVDFNLLHFPPTRNPKQGKLIGVDQSRARLEGGGIPWSYQTPFSLKCGEVLPPETIVVDVHCAMDSD